MKDGSISGGQGNITTRSTEHEKSSPDRSRGITPTVGVVLMLSVTIVLAMVIVPFILSNVESVEDQAPSTDFSFSFEQDVPETQNDSFGNTGEDADGLVTITIQEGDEFDPGQVNMTSLISGGNWVDDTPADVYDTGDTAGPGDKIKIWADRGETLRILWSLEEGGETDVLESFTLRPVDPLIPPGAPSPDEDCEWVEDNIDGNDDLTVDGIVVNCDLDQYSIDRLTIKNGGAVIGEIVADEDVTIQNNAETWGGNIDVNSNLITIDGNAEVHGDIDADFDIFVTDNSLVDGRIKAGNDVLVSDGSKVKGRVTAGAALDIQAGSEITRSVTFADHSTGTNSVIGGKVTATNSAPINNFDRMTIKGDIDADNGDKVYLNDTDVEGEIDATANVTLDETTAINGHVDTTAHINCDDGDDSTINGVGCLEYTSAKYDVTIDDTDNPVEGDTLNVDVTIENIGYSDASGMKPVTLTVGGTDRDSESFDLDRDATTTYTFTWDTSDGDAGDYTANVSSEDYYATKPVTIADDNRVQDGTEIEIDGQRNSVTISNETKSFAVYRTFDDGSEQKITDHTNLHSVTSEDSNKVSVQESAFEITGKNDSKDITINATNNSFSGLIDVSVDAPSSNHTQLITGSGEQGDQGNVTFDLENTGAHSVSIFKLVVNHTTKNNADELNNSGGKEISKTGSLNTDKLDVGSATPTTLDASADIAGGTTAEIKLAQFRQDHKNIKPQDMSSENVKLTLYFADGSDKTIEIKNITDV